MKCLRKFWLKIERQPKWQLTDENWHRHSTPLTDAELKAIEESDSDPPRDEKRRIQAIMNSFKKESK